MRGRVRVLDRVLRRVDVGHVGAGQAGDDRSFDGAGDGLHRLEVARRGDREARLDHVDAQARELLGDLQLLLRVQRDARRLLAVAQRRVEDQYSAGSSAWSCHSSVVSNFGFFSVLVSRLRAAAHALFPPRGEEKKSKVEAERHARQAYQVAWAGVGGLLRHDCPVRRLALIVNPVAGGGRPARALPAGPGGAARTRLRAALRVHEEPRARARAGARGGRRRRGRGGVRRRRADRRGGGGAEGLGWRGRGSCPAAGATTCAASWGSREAGGRVRRAGLGRRAALDLGEAGERTFAGIASCGFDSVVNRIANETTRGAR